MEDVIIKRNIEKNDTIVMLYLTYPERKWKNVINILEHFKQQKARSLLCAKDVMTHPYMCIYRDKNRGRQIIKHDLYRRQDYPDCLEISHFLCIFLASEIKKLNKNMYNKDTNYYKIDEVIDVDQQKDLELFQKAGQICD